MCKMVALRQELVADEPVTRRAVTLSAFGLVLPGCDVLLMPCMASVIKRDHVRTEHRPFDFRRLRTPSRDVLVQPQHGSLIFG